MKVAVIGAGMAGLFASCELEKRGANVTLFESSHTVGGRVKTKTLGGVLFEEGGEWISPFHLQTLSLAKQAKLELEKGSEGCYEVWYQGENCQLNQLWPEAHEDWEHVQTVSYELSKKVSPNIAQNQNLQEQDKLSLAEFLDQNCRSVRGRWLLEAYHRSEEGEDTKRISLLGWLMGLTNYHEQGQNEIGSLRIKDGLSQCAEFLLSSFNGQVRLNQKVHRVTWNDKCVILASHQYQDNFEHVIFTVSPKALLNEFEFDPPLPNQKMFALSQIGASRSMKVLLVFKRPFWKQQSNGYLLTDSIVQQIWPTVNDQPGLVAYICGDQAATLACGADTINQIVKQIETFLPGATQEFLQGSVAFWDPAFSHLPPGFVSKASQHLWQPCGRLHFAGEYAARWLGFVEGALESGERAANEVIQRAAVN